MICRMPDTTYVIGMYGLIAWKNGGVVWMDKRGAYRAYRLSEHDPGWLAEQAAEHEAKGFKMYGVVKCKACGATRYMGYKAVAKEAAKNAERIKTKHGNRR